MTEQNTIKDFYKIKRLTSQSMLVTNNKMDDFLVKKKPKLSLSKVPATASPQCIKTEVKLENNSGIQLPNSGIMFETGSLHDIDPANFVSSVIIESGSEPSVDSNFNVTPENIICLSSDDEASIIKEEVDKSEVLSDISSQTVIYDLSPTFTQRTPQKHPVEILKDSSSEKSPRKKFYSPTKKRNVNLYTPSKRNLSRDIFGASHSDNYAQDQAFAEACAGVDDKTVFLLSMINRCLKNESLKKLLNEKSLSLLPKCMHVVKPGMKLVCRLYWRLEGWYKRGDINSICGDKKAPLDDPKVELMLQSLVENELLISNHGIIMNFDEYATLLKVNELKEICKELKLKVQTKPEAVQALKKFSQNKNNISKYFTGCKSDNSSRVLKSMASKAGICYKLSQTARETLYSLYVLMFLGIDYSLIREKKLELTFINDKVMRDCYPVDSSMELDDASVVFCNKQEFQRYLQAHCLYEDFLLETDATKRCETIQLVYGMFTSIDELSMICYKTLAPWLRRFTPAYIYVKILSKGIQDLKRSKSVQRYELSLDILSSLIRQTAFRTHHRADWYAEKALICHSLLARYDQAAKELLEGFKSDMSEEEKDSMRPRANKIANQKSNQISDDLKEELLKNTTKETILERNLPCEYVYKQHIESTEKGKKKFRSQVDGATVIQGAEEYCVYHYLSKGDYTHGEHWEGRMIVTIFFLLFWDIIYSKPRGISGIFLTKYQRYPLDLFTGSFYVNRKPLIDDRIKKIEESTVEELLEMMKKVWDERPETEQSGIARAVGWQAVQAVCSCLAPRGVSALCRRLATHYRYAHSGFPDLTMWNVHTRRIKFVEVKTDTDKPSIKQIQWMHYLREIGLDAEFCYLGVHTTRHKARGPENGDKTIKNEL